MSLHTLKIEDRRRQVASLIAQSMNETEIAERLGVTQATISRDIKALKNLSQKFAFDLAKSDLAYYYKSCIDGVDEVNSKAWELFRLSKLAPKDKIAALKLIKECNESKFALFKDGPAVLNVEILESRINNIVTKPSR